MVHSKPAPFLKSIAESFYNEELRRGNGYRYRFHFQNKRAGKFFQHYLTQLARQENRVVILPEITTLYNYLRRMSLLPEEQVNNKIFVIHQLFIAYQEVFPTTKERSFDNFFQVGELILNDFNDLDKQLVNVEEVMQNAQDLKDLTANPSEYLDEEQLQALAQFVKKVKMAIEEADDPTNVRYVFGDFWLRMPTLYAKTKELLKAQHLTYEGMTYKETVEKLKEESDFALTQDGITNVFVGLNTFTKSEQAILAHFRDTDKSTRFYWDYDSFLLDSTELAGKFKLNNTRQFPDARGTLPPHHYIPEVEVTAIPSRIAQSSFIGKKLSEWSEDESLPSLIEQLQVAIVLPNERMLLPVLSTLPAELPSVNVTLGYPVRETPVGAMFLRLLDLIRIFNARKRRWRGEEVTEILAMPPLEPFWGNREGLKAKVAERISQEKLFYLSAEEVRTLITQHATEAEAKIALLITELPDTNNNSGKPILDYFIQLCFALQQPATPEEQMNSTVLSTLEEILLQQKESVTQAKADERVGNMFTPKVVTDILHTYFTRARIPYEGEPLKGLQIMGLLETRGLDFDYIFIPDAAEGILPAKTTQLGVIPHLLRQHYGMPTYDWQNTTRSYNFLRLISRAKKVFATYDSRKGDMSIGEPSRYIRLLQYVYDNPQSPKVSFQNASYPSMPITPSLVAVNEHAKQNYQKALQDPHSGQYISPSSITRYLLCPRAFYYTQICGIREPEVLNEILASNDRGTLVHETLRYLYQSFVGRKLDTATLEHWLVGNGIAISQKLHEVSQKYFGNNAPKASTKYITRKPLTKSGN